MSFDQHLAYEVEQMCTSLDLLETVWEAMHGATPPSIEHRQGTAYLEASLLHMRNLIEFAVRGQSANDDSIRPSDVGVPHHDYLPAQVRYEAAMGEPVDDTYTRICQFVSHLSKSRALGPQQWVLQPLRDVLLSEMSSLAESAAEELPLLTQAIERHL